jgi:hypothetical protein
MLMGCVRNLEIKTTNKITDDEANKLVQQVEGKACYWNEEGQVLPPTLLPGSVEPIACQKSAALILKDLAANGVRIYQAVPALISNLKIKNTENHPGHRVKADLPLLSTRTLGMIADPKAIDGLLQLADESKQTWAIKPTDDNASAEQKSRTLSAIYVEIAIALGNIGTSRPDVIEFFKQGLQDKSNEVRKVSARVMADFKSSSRK